MTTEEIRKDLKTIRGYYAERQALESEFLLLPHKTTKLVQAYADAIYDAPLDLYRVYFALYVKGLTHTVPSISARKTRNFWSISERI